MVIIEEYMSRIGLYSDFLICDVFLINIDNKRRIIFSFVTFLIQFSGENEMAESLNSI